MDDLPIYYDHIHGVYRLMEEDTDSGVDELPFSSYIKLEGDVGIQTAPASQSSTGFADSHFELDEDDLTYMDDITDGDYNPYQSSHLHKKQGKSKYMRHHMQKGSEQCGLMMVTPEKQMGLSRGLGPCFDSIRHYARKDRTPRTIMKMMERHRESERVRHHTLNESMKDVCLRVPGYDPDVKETKVIQMQRIIGYECFLENTLASLCGQLGMPVKVLKLGTNFITDAMKDTPIEDFYTPSNYKTSDLDDDEDDDETVPQKRNNKCPTRCRVINASSMDKSIIRYRRDKVSSPTIDSTTDDVTIFPLNDMQSLTRKQLLRQHQYGSWTGHGFTSIEPSHTVLSSQESGIKMETPESSQGDDISFHDIDSLIDQGLCNDPEHLKTVTASFMADELASPPTSADESDVFTLASPKHDSEHDLIFLRSPRPKGIWHPNSTPHSDHFDSSREMQSVSPENVLETKRISMDACDQSSEVCSTSVSSHGPLIDVVNIKQERDTDIFGPYTSGFHDLSYRNASSGPFQGAHLPTPVYTNVTTGGSHHFASGLAQKRSFYDVQGHFDSSQFVESSPHGKNKRKRYTPLRSPLTSITNCTVDIEEECTVPKYKRLPVPEPVMTENFVTRSGLERKSSNKKLKSARGSEENKRPKVDHRRSTWMNGFMMFCQKNRAEIVRANPGVHNSHIQKMLGHLWRNMSAEDQEPYRENARQCSNYLKKVHDSLLNEYTESIVDSGTSGKE